jgi:raffinose/stachyose/melibiose transport system permease protein
VVIRGTFMEIRKTSAIDIKRRTLVIKYAVLSLFAFIVLIPVFITLIGGLKSLPQLKLDLFGLPNPIEWKNITDVLDISRSKFFLNLFNTTFIMGFTVLIDLVMSCLAGFALSRIRFPGRELVFNYFLLGLLFPLSVAILPLYIQVKNIGLLDNYFGVILPQVAFGMPWHIMLARGFFAQVPMEMQEAALMDGCGPFRFFVKIILPLSTPILTTIGVLAMVASWNNFFLPLLVIQNENLYTLPMGVMNFQTQYLYMWNLVLAFLTLAMIPVVIFYILGQKYIITGLTAGAVKE